ncbi:MAG: CDC48 family AAA ATPase [Candidatus Bathyarchaeota archaeon]|nr:CDC48 family AAA ATPase [Candidatus Bathyarchaeota archaeon]
MAETHEVQLRAGDARQRDVGRGIARIDQRTMQKLGISAGDVIEIAAKRTTSAIAWPAYSEDQNRDIIRIDGFTRKNAGVAINEYVVVRSARVKTALSITLAPVDMRLNVDEDFTNFVKNRLMERTLVEGDTTLVMMLGHAIPFTVSKTRPHGIVKVTAESRLTILNEPAPEAKGLPRTTYEDIGGLHDEIQRVREMVELPLRHPELFQRLGIEPPKGVLLHGPPGCGKTLLARAVANESEANFYSINGPEIMSKFYGESEARLREIFQQAQQNSPSIIFIDELDAIAPKREEVTGEVERRVVAQLLALMDGLSGRGNVIVIGATNRPGALDQALRRPGRFDREIEIGVPDKKGRYEVLQIHTRGMPLVPIVEGATGEDATKGVDLLHLAEMTHGYTGADLSALSRETAMKALRRYLPQINLEEERIPPAVLEKMEVQMDDFINAYKEVTPTAMREVYIEVATVNWSDIGGLDEVKQHLKESVEWPIKTPEVFERLGIKPPKGILLYGPPGCGKTLLARAVATESEANFISIKGPEVFSKWVGESEKAIREVFRKARMAAPAVIFFDEMDSLTPQRGAGSDSGVSERVISQLLTEMDGILSLRDIVVVAATNRPNLIDPAVLRPGRFDRLIYVPEPDEKSRLQILKLYSKTMPLNKDVDLGQVALQTKYYSGADLENICREAAMHALRRDFKSREVTMKDFQDAIKEVGPSVSPDMEKWYKGFMQQVRQVQKPTTPVA